MCIWLTSFLVKKAIVDDKQLSILKSSILIKTAKSTIKILNSDSDFLIFFISDSNFVNIFDNYQHNKYM